VDCRIDDHAGRGPGAAAVDDLADHLADEIRADLTHQADVDAQPCQGQPGVRYCATGRKDRRTHDHQPAGLERLAELLCGDPADLRNDIQADVACDHCRQVSCHVEPSDLM